MYEERSIIVEGKNVEEALGKALKAINLNKDQVVVEILKQNQSFLGAGGKQVKLRVSAKKEVIEELELTDILVDLELKGEAAQIQCCPRIDNELDGTIQVRNGRLIVTEPIAPGQPARVKPSKNVRLFVNGQEVKEETPVTPQDSLETLVINDQPISKLEISFSENNLEAFLRYIQAPGASYKVKDQPPTNKLLLVAELTELIEPKTLTEQDVLSFLAKYRVTHGIKYDMLPALLENPNSKDRILIACGKKPEICAEDRIVYPYLLKDQPPNTVNSGASPTLQVQQGEVIAYQLPELLGQAGWSVTGEDILADTPTSYEFIAETGCELVDGGDKVVALYGGRPFVTAVGEKIYLNVYEKLVVEADFIPDQIGFEGDLLIKGDLPDGCHVEIKGNLEILGKVRNATLRAGSNIICQQGVYNSTLTAGIKTKSLCVVLPYLLSIEKMLENMLEVVDKLKQLPRFKTNDLNHQGDGPLIQLLIDSKFIELPTAAERLTELQRLYANYLRPEVSNVINFLKKMLCAAGPSNLTKLDYLILLQKSVAQVIETIKAFIQQESYGILTSYAENSELVASGMIQIEGQGCSRTTIKAGEQVIISGNPGLAQGVKIDSYGEVSIKELKTDLGFPSLIKAGEKDKITIESLHPNNIIQLGQKQYTSSKVEHNFCAYLSDDGELVTGSSLT